MNDLLVITSSLFCLIQKIGLIALRFLVLVRFFIRDFDLTCWASRSVRIIRVNSPTLVACLK